MKMAREGEGRCKETLRGKEGRRRTEEKTLVLGNKKSRSGHLPCE